MLSPEELTLTETLSPRGRCHRAGVLGTSEGPAGHRGQVCCRNPWRTRGRSPSRGQGERTLREERRDDLSPRGEPWVPAAGLRVAEDLAMSGVGGCPSSGFFQHLLGVTYGEWARVYLRGSLLSVFVCRVCLLALSLVRLYMRRRKETHNRW